MREIKFRAIYKERWGERSMFNVKTINFNEELIDGEIPFHFVEIMQFTGLKDKNGKEIYEGDILCVPDTYTETVDVGIGNMPVAQTPENHLAPVEFDMGCFKVKFLEDGELYQKGYSTFGEIDAEGDEIEIIGNIYESPELLQESNK